MKITNKCITMEKQYKELRPGDVFLYARKPYIKLTSPSLSACLENGMEKSFLDPNMPCHIVEAELILKVSEKENDI